MSEDDSRLETDSQERSAEKPRRSWLERISSALSGEPSSREDLIELLRDVFAWAYKRSCARYSAVRQSLGEPDPFRLRYRALIFDTVAEVVRAAMNKQRAIAFVARQARQHLPPADQHRFVEVTETELMSLHEGNMARYRLRPSEFEAWRQGWR